MMAGKYDAFLDGPDEPNAPSAPLVASGGKYDAFLDGPDTPQLQKASDPGLLDTAAANARANLNALRSAVRGEGVDAVLSKLPQGSLEANANLLGGATTLMRGATNVVGSVFGNSKLGQEIWPTKNLDKESALYTTGEMLDPLAWYGGAKAYQMAGKLPVVANAARAIEIARATGVKPALTLGQKFAPMIQGGAAGGTMGAAAGAVSEDGDALSGGGLGLALGLGIPIIGKAANKTVGWIGDLISGKSGQVKASQIARAAAGQELPEIRRLLNRAPSNLTAAQAAADVPQNMWQSLGAIAEGADRTNYYSGLANSQEVARLETLAKMARGGSLEEARLAREILRERMGKTTGAAMTRELDAAGTAGKLLTKLQSKADRFGQAASENVDDVRRFTAVQPRAMTAAETWTPSGGSGVPSWGTGANPNAPRSPQLLKYTYPAELAEKGEKVASDAASRSLMFGDTARFAQSQADSLAAHGLKPLSVSGVVDKIDSILKEPKFAASDTTTKVMRELRSRLIANSKDGIIDAQALHTLRREGINDAIENVLAGRDPETKKKIAGKLLQLVRPSVDDAIESAGGTGWTKALKTWSQKEQVLSRQELASELYRAYKTGGVNKVDFLNAVRGDNPEMVEKILGRGKYQISDIGAARTPQLQKVASEVTRDQAMRGSAEAGKEGMQDVIRELTTGFRFPGALRTEITTMNKLLEVAQKNLSTKTKAALVEGMRNGKSALEMLDTLPASERNKLLLMLNNAGKIAPYVSTQVKVEE